MPLIMEFLAGRQKESPPTVFLKMKLHLRIRRISKFHSCINLKIIAIHILGEIFFKTQFSFAFPFYLPLIKPDRIGKPLIMK